MTHKVTVVFDIEADTFENAFKKVVHWLYDLHVEDLMPDVENYRVLPLEDFVKDFARRFADELRISMYGDCDLKEQVNKLLQALLVRK